MDIKSIPDYTFSAAVTPLRSTPTQQDAATALGSALDTASGTANSIVVSSDASSSLNNPNNNAGNTANAQDQATLVQGKKDLTKKDVEQIADGLNDFMESMNTNIRFVLHNKMQELMVQVVDNKTHKVLREAPPKELLDTIARIRDFVGSLLDKKV
ncbi:MAG: flagellar protein FlaG [Sporomusaceae bacterium]|nr:flagellar protein FlaG [Sporomusaceae bacterium]